MPAPFLFCHDGARATSDCDCVNGCDDDDDGDGCGATCGGAFGSAAFYSLRASLGEGVYS